MDRSIAYVGAIPLDTDFLKTQQNVQAAIAFLAAATVGTATVADGLAATATAPASLAVQVGAGSIYSLANLEPTAFGSLPQDLTHSIVKQGVNLDPTTLALTAPGTAGQSINYLVQASFSEVDGVNVVLPYLNAANPAQPFAGPNNAGTSQATVRQCKVVLSVKAGVAAATGTQTTPANDAGNVPLWVVTVANGQATVIAGNIAQHPAAPFIATKLGQLPTAMQQQAGNYGVDTGTANALAITLTPAPASLASLVGAPIAVKLANALTGAATLNVNGLGAQPIKTLTANGGPIPLGGIEAAAGQLIEVMWDGAAFQLLSSTPAKNSVQQGVQTFTSSGTFTVPAGVTRVWVEGWSGGGGGGGAPNAGIGSGGGSGAYGAKLVTGLTPGQTIAVTIGAAGAAGSNAPGNGGNGGSTSFGAFLSVAGGTGGAANSNGGAGGGAAPTADVAIAGGAAIPAAGTSCGQAGGSAPRGGAGGVSNASGGAAGPGVAPGGGGAGATGAGLAVAGGAGAAGRLIAYW